MPKNRGFHHGQRFTVFNTPLGWMALLASPNGITSLTLPYPTEKAAAEAISTGKEAMRAGKDCFLEAISQIQQYMSGKPVKFTMELDLSAGTAFQQQVWSCCRNIPYGKTRSYSWIAHQVGKPSAARAVGNALNKNPIPIIIPCHRVIAADGSIGGYGGGLSVKRELLALEDITVKE
jgi:methylated-DNA-[protein]-cysteine S-methyltransferase